MDLLAERVVQVGGTAEGTIQVATARTGLKAYPLPLAEERDHVEALSSALAAYGQSVRRAIEQADALGDRDTADIFTEISRGIDKYFWFVEAHLGEPARRETIACPRWDSRSMHRFDDNGGGSSF